MGQESASAEPQYKGALELTWTNKQLHLLANEDGSYEWVHPSDFRVAEVRLLHDAGDVGDVHATRSRTKDNLLVRGDSLQALTSLVELPEFARAFLGKVDLIYIDPPFNTRQSFLHYDDALEHSVWLTMMRDRLLQAKKLLAPHGSLWVHCDDSEQAYLKVMMDELFERSNFVTTFVWRKVDSPNDNKVPITPDHEYILCYARDAAAARFKQMADLSLLGAYREPDATGHRFRDRLLKKNGKHSLRTDRPSMFFGIPDPDGNEIFPMHDDGREAVWAAGKAKVKQLLADEAIIWKRRQVGDAERWVPYVREYAPDVPMRPWPSLWLEAKTTRQAKAHLRELFPGVTPFDTPKPEELIAQIVELATEPGDLVLDFFVGSGTTAAVAHKMGRKWIGVEWSRDTLERFAAPRLGKVVSGDDAGGITKQTDWEGGGGFRVLDVAPSMFVTDGHVVVLSDWAVNGKLSEATAAQLGFAFELDPPFCGAKGRTRLAVVDGLVNSDVMTLLLRALPDDQRLLICGTAVDPAARNELRTLRPGSNVRKIPASILDEYRDELRWLALPKADERTEAAPHESPE